MDGIEVCGGTCVTNQPFSGESNCQRRQGSADLQAVHHGGLHAAAFRAWAKVACAVQIGSPSRLAMSTVAEMSSEPERILTLLIVAVAMTMSPACSGRRKVKRWSPCTIRSSESSSSGSLNNWFQPSAEMTAAKVGGAIGDSPRYRGLSSPNDVANSAILAAETWYGSQGG